MPAFDPLTYRYASRRNVVYAKNAVACTSVPLGAQIGLDVMKSGGSAVDAAVAMAAAMPLLEPTGNGLGSDCFALVWIERDKRLYGLNASGVAPMALSAEKVRAMGYAAMPTEGWLPTMVPGAPAGWVELNRRFGTKPLAELFAPAVSYAEEGYPVPVNVARQWERDSRRIAEERMQPRHSPGAFRIRRREDFQAPGGIRHGDPAVGFFHRRVQRVAGAEGLAAALAGAVSRFQRIEALGRALQCLQLLIQKPITNRKGAGLIKMDS